MLLARTELTVSTVDLESLPDLHGHECGFHPACLLLLPRGTSFDLLDGSTHCANLGIQTSNLTLEEVDHMFTKGGRSGLPALRHRSVPVQVSLAANLDEEKVSGGKRFDGSDGDTGSVEHVEGKDMEVKE
jgi:hypothetical protein